MEARGKLVYGLYRAATRMASPLMYALVQWRRLRGLEHPSRWPERFGHPSSPRPPGPLLWFHAVSLGEGLMAIPVIKHCVRQHPDFHVLMTTTTISAFEVIKDQLPDGVIYQLSPLDSPTIVDKILGYWKPIAVFLMESELWPNLVISAANEGSTLQAVRFQLLNASPNVIHFAGDLKYAVGDFNVLGKDAMKINDLQLQLTNRPVWIAASIHEGEEKVMLWVHKELIMSYPDLVMILVTRHPQHGQRLALALNKQGLNVSLRSRRDKISSSTSVYVVDTLGELRTLYRFTKIAVIGGSFLPGLAGHNVSEAAAAGCAVLTGPHVGHFSHMLAKMSLAASSSVLQVGNKFELLEALKKLLSDANFLDACCMASKHAFSIVSNGVVERVWELVDTIVLEKAKGRLEEH
ncbi:probable 3-deoxy-D-manno-octulosonic acid transferase, mitochondrial isoform X2 [Zingiber officinale]|uniref:probable 3-deoxy-D-manno-octulosonic acid transferase, mitochondrial isoform X2 n=1 Tax=Zingiber officinale TaxID=94328 RepID=UPI001C4D30DF|nr:probable 3-deoxy-D-manno-octulosonic acid transferase, mitochondrial isoform X2 [Zingiber officinale]